MSYFDDYIARKKAEHPGQVHCYYCDYDNESAWFPENTAPRDEWGHVWCPVCSARIEHERAEHERWRNEAIPCDVCGEPELPELMTCIDGLHVCRECMDEVAETKAKYIRYERLGLYS